MHCVCGGIVEFCRAFKEKEKEGKIPKDIHTFRCPCGCYLDIIEGAIWYGGYPVDLDRL